MAGLREDIYEAAAPQNHLLRYWLGFSISRAQAEQSLNTPGLAHPGSYIVRRSDSAPGNYAITVAHKDKCRSFKISDLGVGQVGIETGQAFASLEHLLEFFYEKPFPVENGVNEPLKYMHQEPVPGAPYPPPAPQLQMGGEHGDDVYEENEDLGQGGGAYPGGAYEDADDQPVQYGEEGTYGEIDDDMNYGDGGAPPPVPPGRPGGGAPPPLPPGRGGGADDVMYGEESAYGEIDDDVNYGE